MIRYRVEFPRQYKRLHLLPDYYHQLWHLIQGGHKTGHSKIEGPAKAPPVEHPLPTAQTTAKVSALTQKKLNSRFQFELYRTLPQTRLSKARYV